MPGASVEMLAHAPFGGPVTVRTRAGEHAISRELADRIGAASLAELERDDLDVLRALRAERVVELPLEVARLEAAPP